MKKKFFLAFVSCLLLSACSSDDYKLQENQQSEHFVLKGSLNEMDVIAISEKIDSCMMNTRSNTDTFIQDEQAKRILLPFIEDGENIKAEILNSQIFEKNSDEYILYSNLTEQELIILSLMAITNGNATRSMTSEQIINCLGSAIGIGGGISGLSIKGLCTAQTALQALKAVAKRYCFGYIGLAISVYQFGDCLNSLENR